MQEALIIILEKLKGIKFALIGSFNLSLQGVQIEPHDLDILTDDEGIAEISKIFSSKIFAENEYKETEFKIGDTEVHVVSSQKNPLRPDDLEKFIIEVDNDGLKIPCASLESEMSFYERSGRAKDLGKVKLIEDYLKSRRDK